MTGETLNSHFDILTGDIASGNVREALDIVTEDLVELGHLTAENPRAAVVYEAAVKDEEFLLAAAKSCCGWYPSTLNFPETKTA